MIFLPGLATLLNAASVHKSKYHSLGLSVRQVCPGGKLTCAHPVLELTQFVTLVLNPNIMPENEGGKGSWDPQPVSWSIRSIFGIGERFFLYKNYNKFILTFTNSPFSPKKI